MVRIKELWPLLLLLVLQLSAPAGHGEPAYRELAGDLPGTLSGDTIPYMVIADIYVPQGRTVVIEPGTVLLFKSFTSLQVQGTLFASGTKEQPIVFTSVNDRVYNRHSPLDAAPYDWNGITVHPDAMGSHFANCAVLYSVYGLASMTRFVRIDPCLFLHNGRSNVTIEGKELEMKGDTFSFTSTMQQGMAGGVPFTIMKDPLQPKRATLRYAGLGSLIGAGTLGIVYTSRYNNARSQFRDLSSVDKYNLAENSSREWESARDEKNRDLAVMMIGYLVSLAGAAGVGFSFTF